MCFDSEVRGRGGSCMGIWVNRGPVDGATLLTMKDGDEMRDGK